MIVDAAVFENAYLPETLLHRDAEIAALARAFDPALRGAAPENVLLYGPHGVGKTALCRHTFERLQAETDAAYVHVRAMGKSIAGVLRATLQALGADPDPTTPREDLCVRLAQHVTVPTVVVLDESSEIPTGALGRLIDTPLVGVVPIIHDPEAWLSRLDDSRIRRHFQGKTLCLERYTTAELADILEPRVREGLRGEVQRAYLAQIADRAGGGARTAIQTLRAAAELAELREVAIETVSVEAAYQRARTRIREANLSSLTFDHHVLYEMIRMVGTIQPGDLYAWYERVADDLYTMADTTPVGRRQVRNKLAKLEQYDLIEAADDKYDEHQVCDPGVSSTRVDVAIPADQR